MLTRILSHNVLNFIDKMGTTTSTPTEQKVVLVTGASSGIGKECALALLQRGHIVYGAARRLDKMRDIAETTGGHIICLDICNEQQIIDAVSRIFSEQKRIDVLVNLSGIAMYGAIEDVSMADARRQFDVNLFGIARLTKEVLPHMRNAGKGTIVNCSSIAGKIHSPFSGWYTASKHALEGWSDCLRLELHPFNIKVAIIEPGVVKSDMADATFVELREKSRGGQFETMVDGYIKGNEPVRRNESPASVVAEMVTHASESKTPKRRYVGGYMAKPLLFCRAWCGDGLMDTMLLQTLKGGTEQTSDSSSNNPRSQPLL